MSKFNVGGTLEVAKMLGVDSTVVYNLVNSGKIVPVATIGRRGAYVFDMDEIRGKMDELVGKDDS